jgi:hypothetical protein
MKTLTSNSQDISGTLYRPGNFNCGTGAAEKLSTKKHNLTYNEMWVIQEPKLTQITENRYYIYRISNICNSRS